MGVMTSKSPKSINRLWRDFAQYLPDFTLTQRRRTVAVRYTDPFTDEKVSEAGFAGEVLKRLKKRPEIRYLGSKLAAEALDEESAELSEFESGIERPLGHGKHQVNSDIEERRVKVYSESAVQKINSVGSPGAKREKALPEGVTLAKERMDRILAKKGVYGTVFEANGEFYVTSVPVTTSYAESFLLEKYAKPGLTATAAESGPEVQKLAYVDRAGNFRGNGRIELVYSPASRQDAGEELRRLLGTQKRFPVEVFIPSEAYANLADTGAEADVARNILAHKNPQDGIIIHFDKNGAVRGVEKSPKRATRVETYLERQ